MILLFLAGVFDRLLFMFKQMSLQTPHIIMYMCIWDVFTDSSVAITLLKPKETIKNTHSKYKETLINNSIATQTSKKSELTIWKS